MTSRRAVRKQRPLEQELLQQTSDASIALRGVKYVHPQAQIGHSVAISVLDLGMPTGAVMCFCGAAGDDRKRLGTNTLFIVISGSLQPTSGEVLLPKRWAVGYVPVRSILLEGTLMYSLVAWRRTLRGRCAEASASAPASSAGATSPSGPPASASSSPAASSSPSPRRCCVARTWSCSPPRWTPSGRSTRRRRGVLPAPRPRA